MSAQAAEHAQGPQVGPSIKFYALGMQAALAPWLDCGPCTLYSVALPPMLDGPQVALSPSADSYSESKSTLG